MRNTNTYAQHKVLLFLHNPLPSCITYSVNEITFSVLKLAKVRRETLSRQPTGVCVCVCVCYAPVECIGTGWRARRRARMMCLWISPGGPTTWGAMKQVTSGWQSTRAGWKHRSSSTCNPGFVLSLCAYPSQPKSFTESWLGSRTGWSFDSAPMGKCRRFWRTRKAKWWSWWVKWKSMTGSFTSAQSSCPKLPFTHYRPDHLLRPLELVIKEYESCLDRV